MILNRQDTEPTIKSGHLVHSEEIQLFGGLKKLSRPKECTSITKIQTQESQSSFGEWHQKVGWGQGIILPVLMSSLSP